MKPSFTILSLAVVFLCFGSDVRAGGGPENLILVVNANSDSSKLIANYYVQLRNIPSRNVIYLDDVPNEQKTSLEVFKEKILLPIVAQVEKRELGDHIDYIVYSSDFPTSIDFGRSIKINEPANGNARLMRPVASINSATYFMRHILGNSNALASLYANSYMRQRTSVLLSRPFNGETQDKFNAAIRAMREGDFDESATILRELYRKHPSQLAVSYWLARVFAGNSDAEQACYWLKRAVANGWAYRTFTKSDPTFKNIRNIVEFKEIVDSIPDKSYRYLPTRGFRSSYWWGGNGMINGTNDQGDAYLLSTVLAVTRYRGNSEQEALDQIIASVKADGTEPKGQFYFSLTKNIRSKTRAGSFETTMEELRELGYESEIVKSNMPMRKKDIVGLVMGVGKFNFEQSKSTIVPGAICENLTSFGGRLEVPGQTPLTEFLRFGAAGSSGTVIEPYAIQEKFPHPRIHVHYVKGCSLAEAFYQSVHGPFQLLIVGDALCKPWATFPKVKVSSLEPLQTLDGVHKIGLDFSESPVPVDRIELFIDGRLIQRFKSRNELSLDTATMSDGFHELRIVAIAANAIETQGRAIVPFIVANQQQHVSLTCGKNRVDFKDNVEVIAEANCGEEIQLVLNSALLKSLPGPKAIFQIPAKTLGRGPVKLMAVVKTGDDHVSSQPLNLHVDGKILKVRSVSLPTSSKPKPKSKKKSASGKK